EIVAVRAIDEEHGEKRRIEIRQEVLEPVRQGQGERDDQLRHVVKMPCDAPEAGNEEDVLPDRALLGRVLGSDHRGWLAPDRRFTARRADSLPLPVRGVTGPDAAQTE